MKPQFSIDRRRLVLVLTFLLVAGFMATSLIGYHVSRQAIRDAIIDQDLPLTASNIYSEIQKDLVRPVLVSSTMAHDTFVRDWVLRGENTVEEMARFLKEVKLRHGAFSSFFVSEKTGRYYTADGILKRVSSFEPRDAWYYRVRGLSEDYEINVDPDLANADALTIFVNYRVHDYAGNFIGVTGIGLTVDAVRRLVREYQQRYHRTIYFVNSRGRIVVFGDGEQARDLHVVPGLGPLVDRILRDKRGSYQYESGGDNHILHVNYLPELKWYLFVEQNESIALAGIRKTLIANLAISLGVTLVVIFLTHLALARYQRRLEEMASTDKLTGLLNRHAFTILMAKLMADYRREPKPVSVLMVDIDHFKQINDRHGHLAGDDVLAEVARLLQAGLRASDLAVRWGGEEFLLVLRGCDLGEARRIAENLRVAVAAHAIATEGQAIDVTVSIGASQFDGTEPPMRTVERADAALYRAKHAGRDRVEVDA
ncbi:MAG: sensor domain-containing diguanylate cyclase [Pseudomonadota bacterium]